MRKFIAMVLALVLMLTLSVPVAMAANDPIKTELNSANSATVPTAANTVDAELATAQQNLIISIVVIVVIAAAVIVLIIVKRNNLKDVH